MTSAEKSSWFELTYSCPDLSKQLRDIMYADKLNPTEVARLCNLDVRVVKSILNGYVPTSGQPIEQLADGLQLELIVLLKRPDRLPLNPNWNVSIHGP